MYGSYGTGFNSPIYQNNLSNASMPRQPLAPVQTGLLGKVVDSQDAVKVTDIPLDGSVSYFPLVDGSAILTKKLQMDGTSKIVVYKPVVEEEKEPVKYVTFDDLKDIQEKISNLEEKIKIEG